MKLNQCLGLVQGKKALAKKVETEAYQMFQKPAIFNGHNHVYKPLDEEGERLPGEKANVQFHVDDLVKSTSLSLSDMINFVATQDSANCSAKANIEVDGKVVMEDVPVTTLLFLEKQLTDLTAYVSKIPVLDSGDEWKYNEQFALYETSPTETHRTSKVQEALVLYHATEKHPAQTQLVSKDVVVGYWHKKKFSSAWPQQKKNEVLDRVRKLKEAVISARELANTVDVKEVKTGENVMKYIFG